MIGIDIGTSFIKVCKIINDGSKRSSDAEPSEDKRKEVSVFAAMKSVADMEDGEKSAVLTSLLRECEFGRENAFLAVGGKDLIDKNVFLTNPEEGDEEASPEDSKENIISDFNNSMKDEGEPMYTAHMFIKDEDKRMTNVICTAAPKQIIDAKINIASVKNVSVKGVTIETVALANAFEVFGPEYASNENVVLINMGCVNTSILILKAGRLIFFKDIDFGGQTITKDIATTYTIKEILAEEIKMSQDLKGKIGFYMPNILKRTTSSLIENIFTSMEYCVNKQYVVSIDRIVITGGGALTEGIDSFIEKTMGITTSRWNPLESCKFVGYSDKNLGYFLPISLGLALEKEKK